jgi:thiol-disulfide isomerase/thioredoxin
MSVDDSDFFAGNKYVKELKPADFDKIKTWELKKKSGCSVVLFYCAWCGYCQKVKDAWAQFAPKAFYMDVCAFNCEKNKSHLQKIKEDMPSLVQGFPTIVYYVDGKPTEHFPPDMERSLQNLLKVSMKVCREHK